MSIYSVFKHLAFKFDPEFIHDHSIKLAAGAPQITKLFAPLSKKPQYHLNQHGLNWSFPVGLAAGFDKNAMAIKFFENLGFGAVEIGTVTKEPQQGNPKPRVFRHAAQKSLRNAMGFPNLGSELILKNVKKQKPNMQTCLGVNIGKNKETSPEKTPQEYSYLYKEFAPFADYLVVNISSPNTPGLRDFQKKELLTPIMTALAEVQKEIYKPIFIKIAPDLSYDELRMICELSKEFSFSGVIATNTTLQHDLGKGGVSGELIKPFAQKIRNQACSILAEDPKQMIIGVGGIDSYAEIKDFWKQGGSFVQVYTGLIYQGPALLKNIALAIDEDMKKYQVSNVEELIQAIKQKS